MNIERVYHPPGFTDRVLQVLVEHGVRPVEWGPGLYNCAAVPARVLRQIASLLPREQLDDAWNGRPAFRAFLKVASRVSSAKFDLLVVTKERPDERVTVYAAWLPLSRPPTLKWSLDTLWLNASAAGPSRVDVLYAWGRYYLYLYWD